ncbi:hypothetical protein Hanom_Chr08g00752611 [Helianthus anomalus]
MVLMWKMTMLMVTTAVGRRRSYTGDDCSRGECLVQVRLRFRAQILMWFEFWFGLGSRKSCLYSYRFLVIRDPNSNRLD